VSYCVGDVEMMEVIVIVSLSMVVGVMHGLASALAGMVIRFICFDSSIMIGL